MCPTFSFMRFVSLGGAGLPVPYFHDITEATQENFCMRYKSRSRALVGAALAATLGLAGLTMAAPAGALHEDDRIAGDNRWETAAAAATEAQARDAAIGADTVVLANGFSTVDALAAAGLAGANDAPILLTDVDVVPDATLDAIDTLGAMNIIIVGGTSVVSQDVEDSLTALGYTVTREDGVNRYETAGAIATALGTAPDVGGLATAVLANGLGFADALSISPGAHKIELPVLLTAADTLSDAAQTAIDELGVEQLVVLGGTDAISQAIRDDLEAQGITLVEVGGINRYETSALVADFHLSTAGFTADWVFVASGPPDRTTTRPAKPRSRSSQELVRTPP